MPRTEHTQRALLCAVFLLAITSNAETLEPSITDEIAALEASIDARFAALETMSRRETLKVDAEAVGLGVDLTGDAGAPDDEAWWKSAALFLPRVLGNTGRWVVDNPGKVAGAAAAVLVADYTEDKDLDLFGLIENDDKPKEVPLKYDAQNGVWIDGDGNVVSLNLSQGEELSQPIVVQGDNNRVDYSKSDEEE